jgi:hypothetical protein
MARRVFFSFHYQPDVHRAHVVRNSWVTKADRDDAGFFDASVFESKKRTSDDALKRFLREGLSGSSVTCVLTGNQTAWRPWVRYEVLRSFVDGRGLLNVAIHGIANLQKQIAVAGINPLSCLGGEIRDGILFFKEYDGSKWVWSPDVKSMPIKEVVYKLGDRTNFTFDEIFASYDWVVNRGYENLSSWVEVAAQAAKR